MKNDRSVPLHDRPVAGPALYVNDERRPTGAWQIVQEVRCCREDTVTGFSRDSLVPLGELDQSTDHVGWSIPKERALVLIHVPGGVAHLCPMGQERNLYRGTPQSGQVRSDAVTVQRPENWEKRVGHEMGISTDDALDLFHLQGGSPPRRRI